MPAPSAPSAWSMKAAPLAASRAAAVDREHLPGADLPGEGAKPPQCGKRPHDALVAEPALERHAAPQAAQDLFVEHRGGRPPQAVIDDESHRIGADVDDRYRTIFRRLGAKPRMPAHARAFAFLLVPGTAGGTLAASARPRPESDGLVMK